MDSAGNKSIGNFGLSWYNLIAVLAYKILSEVILGIAVIIRISQSFHTALIEEFSHAEMFQL